MRFRRGDIVRSDEGFEGIVIVDPMVETQTDDGQDRILFAVGPTTRLELSGRLKLISRPPKPLSQDEVDTLACLLTSDGMSADIDGGDCRIELYPDERALLKRLLEEARENLS